ncbi:hypothetical protein BV20DRAFT_963458 [Pilatotrama ljubarskyi]|nr:hypothetical protein BV20DRAFT_963458 [Pilatotrama ljubarskyi]
MTTQGLHCICFDNLHAALEALKPYDDAFMSLSLGSLHDHLRSQPTGVTASSEAGHYLGLYRGEDLLLALTHAPGGFVWELVCPQNAEHLLTPAFLHVAIDLLATTLRPLLHHPTAVTRVFGHGDIVNAFLSTWTGLADKEGIQLRLGDPFIPGARSSYATRETIPPLPSTSSNITLAQAAEADFEELFPLYIDFRTEVASPHERHIEEASLRKGIASGLTWVYRLDGAIAGFIVLGRVSPRTIAIRNVYVTPQHRRKGIAEAMVNAMTRFYLGVRPVGFEGIPEDPPTYGVKDFVCINVADPGAERIYRRAGFLLPEQTADGLTVGGRDPVSGLKAWFPVMMRPVQAVTEA